VKLILSNTIFLNTKIMGALGVPELILIIMVVILLFGGKKLPELMGGLGRGIKEFNNARGETKSDKRDN
jgi:sec-independent protein translocase protein TatA